MIKVIVVGAGSAGFSAALELGDRGYEVYLIEKNTLGSGSSGRNPGRMGHGFHYVDVDTAQMYLRASVKVQRKYPGYLVGQNLPPEHPLRHGRYFITTNSDASKEDILNTYEQIKNEYKRLIAEDPANEVFGPPENFFRILSPQEYEKDINPRKVVAGIETCEHLFLWQKFAADIKQKIIDHPNITLIENTEVVTIKRGNLNEPRFTFYTKKNDELEISKLFKADYFVNSTWQDIERLNDQINIKMIPESRTNRLKALLIIKLPESLQAVNSMFFCMGQHCMMSNMGNGDAMMTFAKVTNMEFSDGLTMTDTAKRLLNDEATNSEKMAIARQMIDGVATFIPKIANAKFKDIKFGIVQTEGKLTLKSLTDANSSFHKRNYHGVREERLGVVSNPCIKLFYFIDNGQLVANIVDDQVRATHIINCCLDKIYTWAEIKNIYLNDELKKMISNNLECHETAYLIKTDPNEIIKKCLQTLELKSKLVPSINDSTFFSLKTMQKKDEAPSFLRFEN